MDHLELRLRALEGALKLAQTVTRVARRIARQRRAVKRAYDEQEALT